LATATPLEALKKSLRWAHFYLQLKSGNNLPANPSLALPVQESLLTYTQGGFDVLEYKNEGERIKIGNQL